MQVWCELVCAQMGKKRELDGCDWRWQEVPSVAWADCCSSTVIDIYLKGAEKKCKVILFSVNKRNYWGPPVLIFPQCLFFHRGSVWSKQRRTMAFLRWTFVAGKWPLHRDTLQQATGCKVSLLKEHHLVWMPTNSTELHFSNSFKLPLVFFSCGLLTCVILESLSGITLMYFYLILPSSINSWQLSGQLLTMAHLPDLVMEMFRLTFQAPQRKLWDDLVIYKTTLWRLYDSDACSCPLVVSV